MVRCVKRAELVRDWHVKTCNWPGPPPNLSVTVLTKLKDDYGLSSRNSLVEFGLALHVSN